MTSPHAQQSIKACTAYFLLALVALAGAKAGDTFQRFVTPQLGEVPPCISSNIISIATYLLGSGANPNFNQGEPLSNAASRGDIAIVKPLEKGGADFLIGNDRVLCSAASSGNVKLVAHLLEKAQKSAPRIEKHSQTLPQRAT